MKKTDIKKLINTFGTPALLILLGGIMLLSPDSAAALIARIVGGLLALAGGIRVAPMLSGKQENGKSDRLLAVSALALGIWLVCNPMMLASALGRFLGILLLITNGRRVYEAWKHKQPLPLLDCVCAGIGALLLVVPLSASRMAISLVGLVLVGIGVAEVFDRLKGRKYLDQGDDPNIIDAL